MERDKRGRRLKKSYGDVDGSERVGWGGGGGVGGGNPETALPALKWEKRIILRSIW